MTETNKKYVRAYNVIVQILSDTKWNNYSKFLIKTKTNLSICSDPQWKRYKYEKQFNLSSGKNST